jgi:hypothetical protein
MFSGEGQMTVRGMHPERRTASRIPVSFGAVLYYNALMLPECLVSDLSLEGAFIATGGHFLPDNALLDLAFRVQSAGSLLQRITAQVVRCTEAGVGVRLQHSDSGSMRNLVETLYAV